MSLFGTFDGLMVHRRPQATARYIVKAALEHGISTIDTAPIYGLGLAEHALGSIAIAERCQVWTKVGVSIDTNVLPKIDYSCSSLKQQLCSSLVRLRSRSVEIVFIHNPWRTILEKTSFKEFADWALSSRSARKVGISLSSLSDLPRNFDWGSFTVLMAEAADVTRNVDLIREIKRAGLSISVRSVLSGGKSIRESNLKGANKQDFINQKIEALRNEADPDYVILAPRTLKQFLDYREILLTSRNT